jgi:hypothetical protein
MNRWSLIGWAVGLAIVVLVDMALMSVLHLSDGVSAMTSFVLGFVGSGIGMVLGTEYGGRRR